MCRSEADQCDLSEHCSGTSEYCPHDAYRVDGTECRAAGERVMTCAFLLQRCPCQGLLEYLHGCGVNDFVKRCVIQKFASVRVALL